MLKLYVDGSWIDGHTGYGAVLLDAHENILKQWCGPVHAEHAAGTRQVAGELIAVGKALQWCKEQGIREVHVYFDYQGIESWATGRWKAKQDFTQRYQTFVRGIGIKIHWHKVAAHTGDRWNDYADQLAKMGAEACRKQAQERPKPTHRPSKGGEAASTAPATMLERLALRFTDRLAKAGLTAEYKGVKNDQYARIEVQDGAGKRAGLFDLYDTAKRPLEPYLHSFKDEALQSQVLAQWKAQQTGD